MAKRFRFDAPDDELEPNDEDLVVGDDLSDALDLALSTNTVKRDVSSLQSCLRHRGTINERELCGTINGIRKMLGVDVSLFLQISVLLIYSKWSGGAWASIDRNGSKHGENHIWLPKRRAHT